MVDLPVIFLMFLELGLFEYNVHVNDYIFIFADVTGSVTSMVTGALLIYRKMKINADNDGV